MEPPSDDKKHGQIRQGKTTLVKETFIITSLIIFGGIVCNILFFIYYLYIRRKEVHISLYLTSNRKNV